MGLKNDFKSTTYGIMGKKPTKYSYCEQLNKSSLCIIVKKIEELKKENILKCEKYTRKRNEKSVLIVDLYILLC